ncbi:MAG: hypothetical protein V4760_02100 [Bdellovibrionota bacterium]
MKNVGLINYTFGPLLLPIIPIYPFEKDHGEIDPSRNLELEYHAYSPAPFGAAVQKLSVPIITVPGRGPIEPIASRTCPGESERCKIFTYPVTVGATPEFILHETEALLSDRSTMKTPRVKFVFSEKTRVDWVLPFAP